MKLWYRQKMNGDPSPDPNQIANIQTADGLYPDIPAPINGLGPITLAAASASGLLVATAPLITPTPTIFTRPTSTPSSVSQTAAPATATATPAPSHGLSPGKVTAAIVAPIGFFAILIPILVLWFLDHRRKVAAEKRASQSNSQRSAKAWEAMPVVEKEYRGSAPARPRSAEPIPTRKPVPEGAPKIPPQRRTAQTPQRSSLGLFNFELTPSSTTLNSRGSIASPRWRLSIARALELRRSEVAVTQVHARSSRGSDAHRPVTGHSTRKPQSQTQPQIQVHQSTDPHEDPNPQRQSETSIYDNDSPPPYMTPRPSEAQAQLTHFAPLDRIGTRRQAERLTASHIAGQMNRVSLAPEPQRNTYASSEIIPPESYGTVRTRSSSPSSEGRLSAHNNGPFSYGLPERLSDVSRLSFDAEHWGTDHHHHHYHRRQSGGSDVSAMDSDESSTMHPHQII